MKNIKVKELQLFDETNKNIRKASFRDYQKIDVKGIAHITGRNNWKYTSNFKKLKISCY